MVSETNCNLATLEPYVPTEENPWNVSKINHLYRRIAFGATKNEVKNALLQNPNTYISTLIDDAMVLDTAPAPEWAFWNRDQFEAAELANEENDLGYYLQQGKTTMIKDLLKNKVRDRLTLFWSNHFVTEDKAYRVPSYQYQYYNLLQIHVLGNFKDFTRDVGICNAMLVYLNGNQNKKNRPNENYARELYELFTLGVDNGYTEDDVQNTAKAITGYVDTNDISWGDIIFDPNQFNTDTKSIFGQTGNWGYEDVIRILFEQRTELIAKYICSKLYAYFVSASRNDDIVALMAQTFISNNFEIAPVLKELFLSKHFFDQEAFGAIIKSPSDLLLCFHNELNFTYETDQENLIPFLNNNIGILGQRMLDPVDVEGWQGDEDWISPDYLIGRWGGAQYMMNRGYESDPEQAKSLIFGLPIGTAADGDINLSYEGADVAIVVKAILDYFLPRGLQNEILFNEALGIFKGDKYPENYYDTDALAPFIWTLDLPGVNSQVLSLIAHIIILPEFQLK